MTSNNNDMESIFCITVTALERDTIAGMKDALQRIREKSWENLSSDRAAIAFLKGLRNDIFYFMTRIHGDNASYEMLGEIKEQITTFLVERGIE